MSARLSAAVEAFLAQTSATAAWLQTLPPGAFAAPTVLPDWDVRTLVAHLVLIRVGLVRVLGTRSPAPPTSAAGYVAQYRPAVAAIAESTRQTADGRTGPDLAVALTDPDDDAVRAAAAQVTEQTVLVGARGAVTALDWVRTRTLDAVVHADDLSRSLPEHPPGPIVRAALADAVRGTGEMLAGVAPGRSVEVRVPPFVAVQVVPGPRHTRGTPPNVVETDPMTWLRVVTGRRPFAEAMADGSVRASGNRADLTEFLPLLS